MKRNSFDDRIKQAQLELTKLRNKRRELLADQLAQRTRQDRKDDLRRKLLAGAWLLEERPHLMMDVAQAQTTEADRAVFKIQSK